MDQGMMGIGQQVTAGAGGMRDAYLRYAEEMMTNGQRPLPPAEWLKMMQQLQQQKMQQPQPPQGGMMMPGR